MIKEEFSWVETHKQLNEFFATKENSQGELIQILKEVGITPLNDKIENDVIVELEEIDPFTFYSYIYKYGPDKRLKNLQNIANKLGLHFPKGQSGIPSSNPQKVWLFPYKFKRKNNEVSRLWTFFYKINNNLITNNDFADVLEIKGTGKAKLTEALFYIDPINYLPINGPTIPYIREVLRLNPNFSTFQEYVELLNNIRNESNLTFYELSYEAWKMSNERKQINYWVFQGNSKVFDFETALRTEILDDWTVSSHKDKIKIGDKVIIWISGSIAGCYALAEITSEPKPIESSPVDHLWKTSRNIDLKAKIRITHNLIDNPILKEEISLIKELTELKVGIHGTNFIAKKEEYEKILEIVSNKNSQSYWLYAPGENSNKWDEFYNQGIIALGWDKLGDLSNYSSKNQINHALKNFYPGDTNKSNDTNANYEFLTKMKIGDIIIPKKGNESYLGYGVVASDYYFDEKRENYKHCRKVEWKKNDIWIEPKPPIVPKTLTDITKYPDYVLKLLNLIGIESIERNEKKEIMEFPLNTIFYGPPGTGKTYTTILRAAEIIKGEKIDSYEEALQIFNENLHNRIEFITFHQNYSYEDFIQGLRPDTDGETQQLRFEKKDGIFKLIAQKALDNISLSKNEMSNKRSFEEVFEEFIKPIVTGEVEEIEVKMKNVAFWITYVSKRSIDFRKQSGGTGHSLSISTLKEFYEKEKDFANRGLASYYQPLLDQLLILGKNHSIQIENVEKQNYVIIIDEINRANISRVFGELITLIEPDKRSEGSIPLTAVLPSGDRFIVPSNLYIIGTMNTADKSIALLDIALRRRFEFEAMYPKYIKDGLKVNDDETLNKLNEKIIKLKGHDFQIGHSYFMDSKEDVYDLVKRMNNKVIPLLMEYFMNDKEVVEKILQDAGLIVDSDSWPLKINGRK